MDKEYTLTEQQMGYLEDTKSILINYDGESTEYGLKSLIDETQERLEQFIYELKLEEG